MGAQVGVATVLTNLGIVEYEFGNYAEAKSFMQESLEISERFGNQTDIAASMYSLGRVAYALGENEEAHHYWVRGLRLAQQTMFVEFKLNCLVGLATVFYQQGDSQEALRLAGIVKPHLDESTEAQGRFDELLSLLETTVSEDELTKTFEAGKALDWDEEIAALLAQFEEDEEIKAVA